MKALILSAKGRSITLKQIPKPVPKPGEALIKLKCAALNRNDIWTMNSDVFHSKSLRIPGSDGAGVVEKVGSEKDQGLVGKAVVINPGFAWGGNQDVQSANFKILGDVDPGTFAEYISVPIECVYAKPAHLSWSEAAALPLAGLSAYRALFTKAKLKKSDRVLITGIGGGVASLALQFALAWGAEVYVTSGTNEKIKRAVHLGASAGFNYQHSNWTQLAEAKAHGFDVILDSAGGDNFASLTELANPAARIITIGRTAGLINNLSPTILFAKQLTIHGSSMGTPAEFNSMLNYCRCNSIRPVIDSTYSLTDVSEALGRLRAYEHFGKVVIKIA